MSGSATAQDNTPPVYASYAPNQPGGSRFPEPVEPDTTLPIDVESAFLVDASLTLGSDYRDRGLSQSDGKPAMQGEITVSHNRSGLFVTAFAATVADDAGANLEIAATLGISRRFGPWTIGAGITGTVYPGDANSASYELEAIVERQIGDGNWGVELAYAPKQSNLGDEDNIYIGTFGEMPLGDIPLALHGSIGVEHGEGGNRKIDWTLGAELEMGSFAFDVSYVDTARVRAAPDSDPTVVVSLSKDF